MALKNNELYCLRQSIASILDYPNVYIGGPSHGSIRKAIDIIEFLEIEISMKPIDKAKAKKESDIVDSWREPVSWKEMYLDRKSD